MTKASSKRRVAADQSVDQGVSVNAAVIDAHEPEVAVLNADVIQVSANGDAPHLLAFGKEVPDDLGAIAFPAFTYDPDALAGSGRDDYGNTLPHVRNESTAKIVAMLVACGARPVDIAIHLDIRPRQLERCYRHELEHGAFPHNMQVAKTILDRAKLGDPRFSMFWAKSRMGWQEGGPPPADDDDIPLMTAQDLKRLVRGEKPVKEDMTSE